MNTENNFQEAVEIARNAGHTRKDFDKLWMNSYCVNAKLEDFCNDNSINIAKVLHSL